MSILLSLRICLLKIFSFKGAAHIDPKKPEETLVSLKCE